MSDPITTDDLLALRRVRALVKSGSAHGVRVAAQLSRAEVARAAQISERALFRWEKGERLPHGAAALRYGRLLDALMQTSR